jgi:hypothetical protein
MQTINKLGDGGKMRSPSFRKHLRRRRILDLMNDHFLMSHDTNNIHGKLAVKYVPIYKTK